MFQYVCASIPKRGAGGLLALFVLASPVLAEPARTLTHQGLGAVRLGMTPEEAERTLGTRLVPSNEYHKRGEPCWSAVREGNQDASIGYMFEDGRLTRIDIYKPESGPSNVRTDTGIGIGSPLPDILRAYPRSHIHIQPPYEDHEEDAYWVTVDPEDPRSGRIRFGIRHGAVAQFWVSNGGAIDYYEGCF